MRPKISYVVAVYNISPFIEECTRSLFQQTLEDIEIIFVNDASTDNSVEIINRTLDDYPQRKSQVKVISHETNAGIVDTRKDGLQVATGEYVNFIDGDDYVEPQMGELMYKEAVSSDADVVVCDFFWYKASSVKIVSQAPDGIIGNGGNVCDDTINRVISPNIWCKLIRRNLLFDKNIIWPTCSLAEDLVLSCGLLYYAKKISHVAIPLYHYRFNPNSISNFRRMDQGIMRLRHFVENNKIIFDFLERNGVTEKYKEGILANKMCAKNEVLLYTNHRKCVRLWFRRYPEVNKIMFFGDKDHNQPIVKKLGWWQFSWASIRD